MSQVVDGDPGVALDLAAARRWALTARAMLAESRDRINALNVFPVPDGDTGTNMFLTMDGSLDVLRGHHQVRAGTVSLTQGLSLIARGMLLSARGNSGVILSQLVRGLHEAVASAGSDVEAVTPDVLVDAFSRADRFAWEAVTAPVEGTILSVSRAAADGAARALGGGQEDGRTGYAVARAALDAARSALARTPQQLPVLARAGVVDAGGAGYVVVIEALERVLGGQVDATLERSWWDAPTAVGADPTGTDRAGAAALTGEGPDCGMEGGGYEVMYLLTGSDPERAQHLRAHLARAGDSALVVGGPMEWRVHVHLAEPEVAVEAGAMAGRVEQVTISALPAAGAGARQATGPVAPPPRPRAAVGVVACAAGEGMLQLLADAGAEVVRSTPGDRASTGQLLSAIWAVEADAVVVLPDDPDTLLAAEAAARAATEDGVTVRVIASRASVQGLAALAVCDPQAGLAANVAAMTEAVRATRHGAVAVASKDGHTPVGPCRRGQVLGLVDGEIVLVADAQGEAVRGVLELLLEETSELVTVVVGEGAEREPGLAAATDACSGSPDVEVQVIDGHQRTFSWLVGVE